MNRKNGVIIAEDGSSNDATVGGMAGKGLELSERANIEKLESSDAMRSLICDGRGNISSHSETLMGKQQGSKPMNAAPIDAITSVKNEKFNIFEKVEISKNSTFSRKLKFQKIQI